MSSTGAGLSPVISLSLFPDPMRKGFSGLYTEGSPGVTSTVLVCVDSGWPSFKIGTTIDHVSVICDDPIGDICSDTNPPWSDRLLTVGLVSLAPPDLGSLDFDRTVDGGVSPRGKTPCIGNDILGIA